MAFIDLDELNKYPIRLNNYDKEHGNKEFVYGIESVLEYANNLPKFDFCPKCGHKKMEVQNNG